MTSAVIIILAVVVSFGISFGLGYLIIPLLHKLKFGQTILDIGPSWHKNKQGTPTMGGIMFIVSVVLSYRRICLCSLPSDEPMGNDQMKIKLIGGLLMALAFGLIGFADDYIKSQKTQPRSFHCSKDDSTDSCYRHIYLLSPSFRCDIYFCSVLRKCRNGIFFWIIGAAALYATVNAVNFTDGIDGLCSSVTMTAAAGFCVVAIMRNLFGVSLLCAALFGALAGFLVWNWNPAKVFMGDIGSNFLGGMVVALAYCLDAPWLILLIGIIYVIEFMSDVIQIGYFKITKGKRIFKMAPIHHHFEKSGWTEKQICARFCIVNAIGCIIAIRIVGSEDSNSKVCEATVFTIQAFFVNFLP